MVEQDYQTVVSTKPQKMMVVAEPGYQTEDDLEKKFLRDLQAQGYEKVNIRNSNDLMSNLREQIEALNSRIRMEDVKFNDNEWDRFFSRYLKRGGIVEKTKVIQQEPVVDFIFDDGTFKNMTIFDKRDPLNNKLQVLNQFEIEGKILPDGNKQKNRFDVTILVNGLPLVHIELKRRGVSIKEAFNQIERYQRDSFWADNGLFEFVQIFVISNGTHTKYFSNTTREIKLAENRKKSKISKTFEFTIWWSDSNNNRITDLNDFVRTFFAQHTLLYILARYCVFDEANELKVMRPYQIVATENILQKINTSFHNKLQGTKDSGGYVWHTTGSGKTLTSFKTAQLAKDFEFIDKVMFVVDRKDLDYQTMKEYDKFQKGAADASTNATRLKQNLLNPDSKIIITTIQKLERLINMSSKINPEDRKNIFNQRIVIIFDEAHRSQGGKMHKAIRQSFKNYYMFGFTGTPIFEENSLNDFQITETIFGRRLHTYTIVDAIDDENVLPFKVDYLSTAKRAGHDDALNDRAEAANADVKLSASQLSNPRRISEIVKYIIDNYNKKTNGRLFNAMLATSSIATAKAYYQEFQEQDHDLKVAAIFSYNPNENSEDISGIEDENNEDTTNLDQPSKDFLNGAIADYNEKFSMAFSTATFSDFYKDLSERVKNKELDLIIVANMMLTGFDAPKLNTLFVDKNLKQHGLIQAFSRTNRKLDSNKSHGNIVSFRDLNPEVDKALEYFGNPDKQSYAMIPPYKELIDKYQDVVSDLKDLDVKTSSESEQKLFVKTFGDILKQRNTLNSFDEFYDDITLTEREFQDYSSVYLDFKEKFTKERKQRPEDTSLDELEFEIDLIRSQEINVDYILSLIEKKDDFEEIRAVIRSNENLRNKEDLLEDFAKNEYDKNDIYTAWQKFIAIRKDEELSQIIDDKKLDAEKASDFIDASFRAGGIIESGTGLNEILPKVSLFGGGITKIKQDVIEQLKVFYDRFKDV